MYKLQNLTNTFYSNSENKNYNISKNKTSSISKNENFIKFIKLNYTKITFLEKLSNF